jgi:cytochrome c556
MKLLTKIAIAASLAVSVSATAQPDKDPVKEAVKYRQSLYSVVGAHMGNLGAMARGKKPYDAASAQASADVLAALSAVASQGFEIESAVEGSSALPAIWEKKSEFDGIMADFVTNTAKLADMAGTEGGLKKAMPGVGKTCKGCHDNFKD